MAANIPTELWLQILSHLRYVDIETSIRPLGRRFHCLQNGLIGGLSPCTWELVFENLALNDLKAGVQLSCYTFYLIVENSTSESIKAALFRRTISKEVDDFECAISDEGESEDDVVYKLHPIIPRCIYSHGPGSTIDDMEIAMFSHPTQKNDLIMWMPLPKLKSLKDNATSPPCLKVKIHAQGFERAIYIDKTARKRTKFLTVGVDDEIEPVTVGEIMNAVVAMGHIVYNTGLHRTARNYTKIKTTSKVVRRWCYPNLKVQHERDPNWDPRRIWDDDSDFLKIIIKGFNPYQCPSEISEDTLIF